MEPEFLSTDLQEKLSQAAWPIGNQKVNVDGPAWLYEYVGKIVDFEYHLDLEETDEVCGYLKDLVSEERLEEIGEGDDLSPAELLLLKKAVVMQAFEWGEESELVCVYATIDSSGTRWFFVQRVGDDANGDDVSGPFKDELPPLGEILDGEEVFVVAEHSYFASTTAWPDEATTLAANWNPDDAPRPKCVFA